MTRFTVTRRHALQLSAAGMLIGGGMAAAPAEAKISDEALRAQFLDPIWNRETSARLEADITPNKYVFGSASGVLNAVVDGQKVKPLLRFEVFSTSRVLKQADGSYQRLSREVVFYRDLDTRQLLETWKNPLTNETLRVVDIANDPFNWIISEYYPDPPSYGGLNQEKPPRRPFLMNWGLAGNDMVTLESDINLFYPSALQPDKWPRESPGKMTRASEYFRYFIRREDLANPRLTHLPYVGTWSRITPWLPWMLMDQAPGHMMYVGTMTSRSTPEGIAADVMARVKQRYPKYLVAPEKWQDPSLSSLEHYAREQQPAPPKQP
jgi:Protein of unknown function (DUF1838)